MDIPPSGHLNAVGDEPLMIKLTTGDELMARIYIPAGFSFDETPVLFLHRPIQLMVQYGSDGHISTWFKKWLILSADDRVPIYRTDVLTIVKARAEVVRDYAERAARVYETTPEEPATDEERDELERKAKEALYENLLQSIPVDEKKLN